MTIAALAGDLAGKVQALASGWGGRSWPATREFYRSAPDAEKPAPEINHTGDSRPGPADRRKKDALNKNAAGRELVPGQRARRMKPPPRTRSTSNPESQRQPVVVIKLEHMRDRPPRFAHLWETADVGSVFRFSGALDGFGNPLASAQYWCRKYRSDLEVSHCLSVDGVLHVRFIKAEYDDEPVVRRYDGDGLTGR